MKKKNPFQIKDLEQFSRCLIERTKLIHDRLNSFDKKKYDKKKRKKLKENWNINKKVLVLAEIVRKKSAPGKFYKQSVQNMYLTLTKRKYFSLEKSKKLIKSATTG